MYPANLAPIARKLCLVPAFISTFAGTKHSLVPAKVWQFSTIILPKLQL